MAKLQKLRADIAFGQVIFESGYCLLTEQDILGIGSKLNSAYLFKNKQKGKPHNSSSHVVKFKGALEEIEQGGQFRPYLSKISSIFLNVRPID